MPVARERVGRSSFVGTIRPHAAAVARDFEPHESIDVVAGISFGAMSRAEIAAAASQLARYASVGVATNVASYLVYLWLTRLGLAPMAAATIAFAAAVAASFALNRNVTFRGRGDPGVSFCRYIVAYMVAYGADIGGLYVLVNLLGFPHEIAQLGLIVFIACGLFVAQKWWVFADGIDAQTRDRRDRSLTSRGTSRWTTW
jgi:putative flippase GtrA